MTLQQLFAMGWNCGGPVHLFPFFVPLQATAASSTADVATAAPRTVWCAVSGHYCLIDDVIDDPDRPCIDSDDPDHPNYDPCKNRDDMLHRLWMINDDNDLTENMVPVDETQLHEMQEMALEDLLSRCVDDTEKERTRVRRARAEDELARQGNVQAQCAADQY